jgi:hypothetical protein
MLVSRSIHPTTFDGLLAAVRSFCAVRKSNDLVSLVGLTSRLAAWDRCNLPAYCARVSLLSDAGRPLSTIEIKQGITALRGVNEIIQINPADPLIRVGKGVWGLNDRDVPIKRADQPALIEGLIAILCRKQSGIHISEMQKLNLGSMRPGLSPQIVFSLATRDRRLRVNSEEYLFLDEWGSPRRESLMDAVSNILIEDPRPIGLDGIVDLAEIRMQRPCTKAAVLNCLQALNAKYDTRNETWTPSDSTVQQIDEDDFAPISDSLASEPPQEL